MTYNECIKALEDCSDKNEVVVSVYESNDKKTDVTIQDVLDIITHLQEENKRLSERHGEWVDIHDGQYPYPIYQCSVCHDTAMWGAGDEQELTDYCPNCGAKMDGKCEE